MLWGFQSAVTPVKVAKFDDKDKIPEHRHTAEARCLSRHCDNSGRDCVADSLFSLRGRPSLRSVWAPLFSGVTNPRQEGVFQRHKDPAARAGFNKENGRNRARTNHQYLHQQLLYADFYQVAVCAGFVRTDKAVDMFPDIAHKFLLIFCKLFKICRFNIILYCEVTCRS